MKVGFASTAVKTCVVFHAVDLSVSSRVPPGTRMWEALNYFAFANYGYASGLASFLLASSGASRSACGGGRKKNIHWQMAIVLDKVKSLKYLSGNDQKRKF